MNFDNIIKILVLVIVLLLIGTLLMLGAWGVVSLLQNDQQPDSPAAEQQTGTQTENLPTSSTPDTSALLGQTADMGQDYIDSMIFLGDSTTYHLINRAVLTDGKQTKQVWSGYDAQTAAPSGTLTLDNTITTTKIYYPKTGEAMTIAEAVAKEKPQYLVITLGVNGIAFVRDMNNPSSFVAYYGKLIDAVKQASPDTKIILQSIFPVTESYDQKGGKLCNANIDIANGWIMQLAAEKGCKYLDTASVLKNDNGTMIAAYDAGDGIHMTADGYKAILQYIRTHGYSE